MLVRIGLSASACLCGGLRFVSCVGLLSLCVASVIRVMVFLGVVIGVVCCVVVYILRGGLCFLSCATACFCVTFRVLCEDFCCVRLFAMCEARVFNVLCF